MYYDVSFHTAFSTYTPVRLTGRGRIHVLETSVIFEGRRSDEYIPLVTWWIQSIISSPSIVTVPYLAILGYRKPKIPGWAVHHLYFRGIDDCPYAIGFRFRRLGSRQQADLAERLAYYQSILHLEHQDV